MSKENSGFTAFYAACAEHHAEISRTTRGLLIGAAIVLAMVALLLQALVAHPLPPLTSDLVGQAAFNGFEPMAAPMSPADNQPTVDANAILLGMFLAVGVVTGLFASVAFLVDCTARVGAFAHRLSTGRKVPEAEGGD